jgi:chromosome partitioning protein
MPVIAVINPKGGSGKSTLATHLAGHGARLGLPVMLGDVDRQRSTLVWLRRRGHEPLAAAAPIVSWVIESGRVLRAPPHVSHAVLDTPAGLGGHELARVVMSADAVLVPVCGSVFDREAAAQCWSELRLHPRVSSGRCRVGAVGMRIDGRSRAQETLKDWAGSIGLPFVGVLPYSPLVVDCIERGLTLFDLPPDDAQGECTQWQPILDWLDPLWTSAPASTPQKETSAPQQATTRPTVDAEGRALPTPVRVTPAVRTAPAQDRVLADALAPRAQRNGLRGSWIAQTVGWLSGSPRREGAETS